MKPRIAINGGFVGQRVTGLQRYAIEMSRRILEDESVRVIYPAGEQPPPFLKKGLVSRPPPPLFRNFRVGWDMVLPRYLEKGEFLWSPCNLGPPIRRHAVTVHDLAVMRNPAWFSAGFALKYRLLLPQLLRRSRIVFTVSNTIREELCEYLPDLEGRVVVAPLGVSREWREAPDQSLPDSLGAITERPYYVTVGSIDPRKNLMGLLREWELFQAQDTETRLLVIGATSGAFRAAKIAPPPGCELLGYQSDEVVIKLIRNARGLIYPSLYEGFSIPPLEAMSLGTPALISDIPVHRENFGDFAYFFDPTQRGALADLLATGHGGVRHPDAFARALEQRFNWKRSASTILHALKTAATDD